jgi:hypothetical protein
MKVENVADDGIQREVEGGDHRFLLQPDHRGQQPPVEPAAQDRGRRQDLPGRVVQRLGVTSGSRQRTGAAAARPTRPRSFRSPRGGQQRLDRPQPGHRDLVPVHRCRRDDARRRAEPPVTATPDGTAGPADGSHSSCLHERPSSL